jgi:hypothetical protein
MASCVLVAELGPVTVHPVVAARVVRSKATAPEGGITGIDGAIDAIIALPVVFARTAERGIRLVPAVDDEAEPGFTTGPVGFATGPAGCRPERAFDAVGTAGERERQKA